MGLSLRSLLGSIASPFRPKQHLPPDVDPKACEIINAVRPYTMTSVERLFSLVECVRYVVRANVPGGLVECGVWRGGSMMAAALALQEVGVTDRPLHLFDTFEGMSRPSGKDVSLLNIPALPKFERTKIGSDASDWCNASLEDVRRNMATTGYPSENIRYVPGKVEDTIPGSAPGQIAILRLDTDWYESTKHELTHLYPLLSKGGILIIDDYGHWKGSRAATDEYFEEHQIKLFLHRVDYTARLAIKN